MSTDFIGIWFVPTAPVAPKALTLQSRRSNSSLTASWASTAGAEWLHFTLQNLHIPNESITVSTRKGVNSYTFQHLQPGTPYFLKVSVSAGHSEAEGPNATAYTCEYGAGYYLWHYESKTGLSVLRCWWNGWQTDLNQSGGSKKILGPLCLGFNTSN